MLVVASEEDVGTFLNSYSDNLKSVDFSGRKENTATSHGVNRNLRVSIVMGLPVKQSTSHSLELYYVLYSCFARLVFRWSVLIASSRKGVPC